ncbi:MAG: DUF6318 family protein [Jatrophihabitans sp.]|uniref:DUF6318 family protein n=1 Tax=Jatrophihabitans sp. TaxID=1932789 RepID=UPI003F7FCCC2
MLPAVGTTHTAAGAEAFAKFFVQTLDWGFATTSSTYMRRYFANSCVGCLSYATSIDKTAALKAHYIGGRLQVQRAQLNFVSAASEETVVLTVDSTAGEAVRANGSFLNADPAHKGATVTLTLAWRNAMWTVTDLRLQL